MTLAGLWDRWQKGDAEPLETFTIIVGAAPPSVAPYHDRAPVIVEAGALRRVARPSDGREAAGAAVGALRGRALAIEPVSKAVNSPRNDFPRTDVSRVA